MRAHVVFSGIDGAGKTTQICNLTGELRAEGQRVSCVWMRGGYTPFFTYLKRFVRKVRPTAVPMADNYSAREKVFSSSRMRKIWLTLAILDMGLLCVFWLRCLKWSGRIVLCDRYVEDTLLDFRRKFSQEHVDDWLLWRLMVKLSARPDYRILLLVTPVESVRRSVLKNEPFPDSIETLAWRYDQYREMARTGEWLVIDCSQPFSIVRETIRAALQK